MMKECVLVVGTTRTPMTTTGYDHDGRTAERLVVRWDRWEAHPGEISLEERLRHDLTTIRAEHAAWAYDLGYLRISGREVRQWLQGGSSLSMWWCSLLYERHPKMTPGLYLIYKLRTLERLLDDAGCSTLRMYGGEAPLRKILSLWCAVSHRVFVEEDMPIACPDKVSFLRRMYEVLPAPFRALLRYAHWYWTVRRHLRPAKHGTVLPQTTGQSATIVTYFPNVDMEAAGRGRFRSRYWESLHDALERQARREGGQFVRWVFVRFPSPQGSLAQCAEMRDRFRAAKVDGASFHYLEEFLTLSDLMKAWLRYLRIAVASRKLENVVRHSFRLTGSRLNFWNVMSGYWAESFRGWRCLERCLQQQAFEHYAALAGPQRWTLFPLENCPWERMLTWAMHHAGNGKVVGAQHSTIRPTDLRYFDDPRTWTGEETLFQPDSVCGNGQSACGQWRAVGVPEDRLILVEALRYLYLSGTEAVGTPPHAGRMDLPVQRRLLVVTSFFQDETSAHLELLAQAVKEGLLDGWEVRVKPHPYLPVQERLHVLLGKRASHIVQVEGAVADHLTPGVVVWASNSTTVSLEAAVKGLPVTVMLPVGDFDLCPLQDISHLPRTGTLADVARWLNNPLPVPLPDGYLELDTSLARWKRLLDL